MIRLLVIVLGLWLGMPPTADAWWNPDWTHRKKITLDTSETGADIREDVSALVVPIRLHTGNFAFADAKEDGADLRFVSADDKTPLKYHVERIDALNELAIVWVQLPKLAASSKDNFIWMYYGNPKAPAGDDRKGSYEASQLGVYHFAVDALHQDATGHAHHPSGTPGKPSATGFINGALALDGQALEITAAPTLAFAAKGGVTFSAWLKTADAARAATLFSVGSGGTTLSLGLDGGKLSARLAAGTTKAEAAAAKPIASGTWTHVALTLSAERLAVYVDGVEAGSAPAKMIDLAGPLAIGAGFVGELDEAQVANVARSGGWIKAAYAAQAPQGKLVGYAVTEGGSDEGGASYMTILLSAVTLDGWVVIGILAVMAVVSFGVMLGKSVLIARTARANSEFRDRFAAMVDTMEGGSAKTALDDPQLDSSSLYRVYRVGLSELVRRFDLYEKQGAAKQLSPQALGAIKASIDAGLVRENERLNRQMVLLTIAISGGPFLGLLGTVVGVMITFAAIAAAGDVNVNAIAPGIAAALVATVAGLGVAIPALFGYNYLASRIKELSNDTAVFGDELVSRFAEKFAP